MGEIFPQYIYILSHKLFSQLQFYHCSVVLHAVVPYFV